ncbi:hypothetical protein H6F86_12455 [Phormidium sp. FACHB-592]|uniref:Uncharacterized protein n=1 Tax=Stenomitos frigidus AS-A4 TaxID=2933935 RepID=A0ABV0KLJ6_9CYAN|nr:hypothetical protein [Phormidium sp. FACHB-592]MBD2074684.1 hypothetical protein [Phormidium sp. FACHB-592]
MTIQQPALTALAKQGDLNAIAALMNRALQPQGIGVKIAHQKGHLRVLLEGQTVPGETVLAPYIRKGILALQIPGLHTLSVLGQLQGADTPAWSKTFALTAPPTALKPTPDTEVAPAQYNSKQPVDYAESKVEAKLEDHSIVKPELNASVDLEMASVANPTAIASHINQALGTETLTFEATLDDRTLKLIAKTNQILEGDTFAKAVQNLLLPFNLAGIDTVFLYKQKTNGKNPYKIKEFTLLQEPATTEVVEIETKTQPATQPSAAYSQLNPSQPILSRSTSQTKLKPQASSQASQRSKFVMLGLTALFVVVFIGAIKFLAKPPAATEICQDAAGAPGYCQLAVQMVGEQTLHDLKTAATPFTPEMEAKGLSFCENTSDLQIQETQRNPSRRSTRYSASIRPELVFPGVMLVETQLKASPQANTPLFRTACLFTGNENQVELITKVVLPNGWPQEPYQGKQEWEPMQRSLKVYQILIMLGSGTLFTAIGLFASAAFNLGFQIYTIRGLFRTASILGTLDTLLIVMTGAKLNLFGGIPLTCLALGLTQIWVKDLRVDWTSGYRTVAFGVSLMILIRFILNWLLLGFIFSVL